MQNPENFPLTHHLESEKKKKKKNPTRKYKDQNLHQFPNF